MIVGGAGGKREGKLLQKQAGKGGRKRGRERQPEEAKSGKQSQENSGKTVRAAKNRQNSPKRRAKAAQTVTRKVAEWHKKMARSGKTAQKEEVMRLRRHNRRETE